MLNSPYYYYPKRSEWHWQINCFVRSCSLLNCSYTPSSQNRFVNSINWNVVLRILCSNDIVFMFQRQWSCKHSHIKWTVCGIPQSILYHFPHPRTLRSHRLPEQLFADCIQMKYYLIKLPNKVYQINRLSSNILFINKFYPYTRIGIQI